jgi:hypothetical protein
MSALEGRQDDGDARAGLYLDSNINSSSSNINSSSSSSSRPLDGMVVVLAGAVLPGGTKVSIVMLATTRGLVGQLSL